MPQRGTTFYRQRLRQGNTAGANALPSAREKQCDPGNECGQWRARYFSRKKFSCTDVARVHSSFRDSEETLRALTSLLRERNPTSPCLTSASSNECVPFAYVAEAALECYHWISSNYSWHLSSLCRVIICIISYRVTSPVRGFRWELLGTMRLFIGLTDVIQSFRFSIFQYFNLLIC